MAIQTNLETILNAKYGADVRQAIHDAIEDCYEDGHAGEVDLIAREGVADLIADLYYTDGDSFLTGGSLCPYPGFVAESNKTIRFNVTVPKSMKNIDTVTVVAFKGAVVGDSGYINSKTYSTDWMSETGISFSTKIVSANTLRIDMISTSDYTNISNNKIVVYSPYDTGLALSFSVSGE